MYNFCNKHHHTAGQGNAQSSPSMLCTSPFLLLRNPGRCHYEAEKQGKWCHLPLCLRGSDIVAGSACNSLLLLCFRCLFFSSSVVLSVQLFQNNNEAANLPNNVSSVFCWNNIAVHWFTPWPLIGRDGHGPIILPLAGHWDWSLLSTNTLFWKELDVYTHQWLPFIAW